VCRIGFSLTLCNGVRVLAFLGAVGVGIGVCDGAWGWDCEAWSVSICMRPVPV
jgi:hypothetical protein